MAEQKRIVGIKRDTSVEGARRAAGNIPQKCGDCLFFKGETSPSFDAPCSDRGVREYASAPRCFSPNVRKLAGVSSDTFELLGTILSLMDPTQTRLLNHLVANQHMLAKAGFYLMQPLFFRVGDDYLDNYFKGFALSMTSAGDVMLCSAPYLRGGKTAYAQVSKQSLLDQFNMDLHRAELIEHGKIYEPRKPHKNTDVDDPDYVIPTIETSVELLEEHAAHTAEGSRKKRKQATVKRNSHISEGGYEVLDISSYLQDSDE